MKFQNRWKHRALLTFSLLVLSQGASGLSYADNAAVLPQGRVRLLIDSQLYFPVTQRYNTSGDTEDVAKDFNTNLNSAVFPGLGQIESAFGLPAGSASFGKSVVSFRWDFESVTLQPAYGLTDRLTIGANIPFLWQTNHVSAQLNTQTATIGINPAVPGGIAPLSLPGTRPATVQDIQKLLGTLGFKPVQTWSGEGFEDIEAGGKYQYFRSENWQLAFSGGVRFPSGKVDDPDNLVDRGFGTGAYALLARFQQDYMTKPSERSRRLGLPDSGGLLINTTFRYDYYLPSTQTLRVCNIHQPLCPFKGDVSRKIGDTAEAETSVEFGLLKGLSLGALYEFGHKFRDHNSGDQGFDYGSLAIESDYNEHVYILSLSYSTVPLYAEKQFPFPMTVEISYRDRFAGTNNLYPSQYMGLSIALFF